jgi:hypothetical protein
MQITIVQAEIEEAIKGYVTGQIALKPGQEIAIELKATRGAEGYQAIINIGHPGEAAPVMRQRQIVTTTDLKRMQAEEEAAEAAAGSSGGEDAGETEAGVDTGASTVKEGPAEVAQPAAAPAAGPAKKRLFGNVVKPNNAAA